LAALKKFLGNFTTTKLFAGTTKSFSAQIVDSISLIISLFLEKVQITTSSSAKVKMTP
jgi:hypothetical protein